MPKKQTATFFQSNPGVSNAAIHSTMVSLSIQSWIHGYPELIKHLCKKFTEFKRAMYLLYTWSPEGMYNKTFVMRENMRLRSRCVGNNLYFWELELPFSNALTWFNEFLAWIRAHPMDNSDSEKENQINLIYFVFLQSESFRKGLSCLPISEQLWLFIDNLAVLSFDCLLLYLYCMPSIPRHILSFSDETARFYLRMLFNTLNESNYLHPFILITISLLNDVSVLETLKSDIDEKKLPEHALFYLCDVVNEQTYLVKNASNVTLDDDKNKQALELAQDEYILPHRYRQETLFKYLQGEKKENPDFISEIVEYLKCSIEYKERTWPQNHCLSLLIPGVLTSIQENLNADEQWQLYKNSMGIKVLPAYLFLCLPAVQERFLENRCDGRESYERFLFDYIEKSIEGKLNAFSLFLLGQLHASTRIITAFRDETLSAKYVENRYLIRQMLASRIEREHSLALLKSDLLVLPNSEGINDNDLLDVDIVNDINVDSLHKELYPAVNPFEFFTDSDERHLVKDSSMTDAPSL